MYVQLQLSECNYSGSGASLRQTAEVQNYWPELVNVHNLVVSEHREHFQAGFSS